MKNLWTKSLRFLISEEGPTAVEYAVMLALIIVLCIATIRTLGLNLGTLFTDIANSTAS
jgi:pilus assembly protein Flp/PilA